MTDTVQLALDGLTYDPPQAVIDGTQTIWSCAQCGGVFMQLSAIYGPPRGKPAGDCPTCGTHSWRKARLPIVGLDHARCEACDRALDVDTGERL